MARRGRPRKKGARYPSGELRRHDNKPQFAPISPAVWQRIAQHGNALGLDPRMATVVGRLNRYGELTAAQTAAAIRIGEIFGNYEAVKGIKRGVRSPSYQLGYSAGSAEIAEELMTAEGLANLERRIQAATAEFQRLVGFSAENGTFVPGNIPPRLLGPVEDLCVSDLLISPVFYPDIRVLFDSLAFMWWRSPGTRPPRARSGPTASAREERKEPLRRRGPDLDRVAWVTALGKLRPDLSGEQLTQAYDFTQALKQRAILRNGKTPRKNNAQS